MFKKIVSSICLLIAQKMIMAQVNLPVYPDSIFSTYYHQRVTLFRSLPQTKGDIIFVGNSITEGGGWNELFDDRRVNSRGISGDITAGVIHRIDEIAKRKPAKIFLMIGTNDLSKNISPDSVVKNILLVAAYLWQQTPSTKVYVQSVLPVNNVYGKFGGHTSKAEQIKSVNDQLKEKAAINHYRYIDLHTPFSDENGKLKADLTNDGLHLKGEAYLLWKHIVYPYVYDLQAKPSLIPLPQSVGWKSGDFPLYACKTIVVKDDELKKEAERLKQYLQQKGFEIKIAKAVNRDEPFIEMQLDKNFTAPQLLQEAYRLNVEPGKIIITANTAHGIFNGIQTLQQLMRDGVMVNTCEIVDWPAFSWRGYMMDVGRNFMSMDLLKRQIDVMAMYKLNVFHFHATEDIAWRIAIKQYPELTAPENMLRNKGQYYSEADIKELIAYCKERYITFVPEIDMPGHSAAFKRAMKTDMQSDTGVQYLKNILKEFCTTYNVPYIHIGADEVKITNQKFVPELTAYIESLGKKIIGWQPGGNFTDNTIRQLWMDDNAHLNSSKNIKYIDSKHLYLNHMDPLEAVVTIFNREICDKEKGDSLAIGATLCMWHDRAIANEADVLRMNPVYPGMLAFAERSWKGGGQSKWVANISDGDEKAFTEFENRLLDNKQQYFSNKPFSYIKQSGIQWKLFGPYDNGGVVSKKFLPETTSWNETGSKIYKEVTGGTIILRHWWAPLIKGAIDEPKENKTWYATTIISCEEAGERDFWIGFNNLSRSPATDSPPAEGWDNKGSAVWVNGKLIAPLQWKRPGQKGHADIPLIDEGYEYRTPTKIFLKKGLNTVLLKLPVASFKGKDWQNPVKWMFTFVEIANE